MLEIKENTSCYRVGSGPCDLSSEIEQQRTTSVVVLLALPFPKQIAGAPSKELKFSAVPGKPRASALGAYFKRVLTGSSHAPWLCSCFRVCWDGSGLRPRLAPPGAFGLGSGAPCPRSAHWRAQASREVPAWQLPSRSSLCRQRPRSKGGMLSHPSHPGMEAGRTSPPEHSQRVLCLSLPSL